MMTTTTSFAPRTTTHPRICHFYDSHPSIDFDTVNVFVVDMLEKLFDRVSPSSEGSNHMMLTLMTDLTSSVSDLKQSIYSFHTDTMQQCMQKLLNVRKEYIEELKLIVNTHTTEQLRPLLESNNLDLINKTTTMIHESMPRGQTQGFHQLQESIRFFQKSISDDTRQLIKHMDNPSNLKEFIDTFEQKSTQWLVQPLSDMISSAEERIVSSRGDNDQIVQELSDFLQQYKSIVPPPREADVCLAPSSRVHVLLNQLYPSSEVSRVSRPLGQTASAAAFVVKRSDGKPRVLVEHKDVDENVGEDDIRICLQDVEQHECNCIFLSARSGFSHKGNYQIEQHQGYFIIYIHCVEYNSDKIRVAMDVLDHLTTKWKETGGGDGSDTVIHMDADVLDKIHQEHQAFVTQKDTMIQLFKDNQRKTISQLEELRFPILDRYLSTKFVTTSHKPGMVCNMCKQYYAHNLKALAAHKRGCARKQHGSVPLMFASNVIMVPSG